MSHHPHLTKAPITEALIDIKVILPSDFDHKTLEQGYEALSPTYPLKIAGRRRNFLMEEDSSGGPIHKGHEDEFLGYHFKSQEGDRVVQFRLDGFTFNKLKPYTTWEKIRDEAKPLWEIFTSITKPETVTRVALRYINKLDLPAENINEFSDYLTTPPDVPEGVPQGVLSFLSRIVITEPKIGANAIITQSYEGMQSPDILPILLDIDVYCETSFEPSDDALWEKLEQLRILKNELFFKSINERAVEVFK